MGSFFPTDAELLGLADEVASEVVQRRLMLVTAESCSGGWVAKTLTDLPGSSAWFHAGVVAYSYEAKEALLGVNPGTLEHSGAVNEETVLEIVSGALARFALRKMPRAVCQRHHYIFQRAGARKQIEALKNEANLLIAEIGALVGRKPGDLLSVEPVFS